MADAGERILMRRSQAWGLRNRWFADSSLEGSGFEPSVPLPRLSSIRAVRAEIIGRSTDVFRRDREFDVSALQGRLSTSSQSQCSTDPGLIAGTWHRPLFLTIAVGTPITGRPPQSGRIEARTGLRMMPTSPRSPLSFRTAGFPQYGWKDGVSDGAFPTRRSVQACSRHTLTTYWFASVLRASRRIHECPAQCRVGYAPMHRRGGWVILLPRGPRSSPGCAVPVCHHLIDPIRPTRRHITTSPQGGLYAMPSLCGSA